MFGLSAKHFSRYRQLGYMLYKYGRSDIVQQSGLLGTVGEIDEVPDGETSKPEQLANDLEEMGPAFVKLGQLLSTRPDFLPAPYLEALSRLQDNAGAVPWEEIKRVIESELGVEPHKLFGEFSETPLASASLGQVHRATMRDGRKVVVKVQRPDIIKPLTDDLEALSELAHFLETHTELGRSYQIVQLVASLESSLKRELDYVQEAQNCLTLTKNLTDHPRIVIPQPITDLTTRRVLTMEYVQGSKITNLSETVLIELDRNQIADDIFNAYLNQVLVDGVFHADPHPGNLALTDDRKIALMDFGLVCHVPVKMRGQMVKLVLALAESDGETAAQVAEAIGEQTDSFDSVEFRKVVSGIVAANANSTVEQMSVGTTMMELQRAAGRNGLALPDEMMLLGKTLMNLDRVVLVLAPDFDPNAAIKAHATEFLAKHAHSKITLATMYHSLLESAEFAQELPSRANKLLSMAAENELRVKVDSIDEEGLIRGINKIANRITAGLIVAALVVGASLIMRLDTPWKIFGYPALATIFFVISASAAVYLLWQAMFVDD